MKKARPSLTIDPEVMADLKHASKETGISVSALATACCRQQLAVIVSALTGARIDPTNFIVGDPTSPKPLESIPDSPATTKQDAV